MATLVLSTVGTVLGGPVGSAIGALIGQSIDQELLAPARRGPRVGDLSVQTSSYGTQIPRVYGIMRVAGSVIWATDLIEHSEAGGVKGQPDVGYSYTVSMAVALSSRPAKAVRRIWADGKLLRGEAGDFKVGTRFRFHSGYEDQAVDPFIASAEGISNTPAYRGCCLAMFEDLELGEFGNRIPFLTFEVEADEEPPSLGSILADVSSGTIACDAEQPVRGFAAYGSSVRSAVEPIIESFGIELFDDGERLRHASAALPLVVTDAELGNSADGRPAPRLEREQSAAHRLPAALRLTYYDPARDYQVGEVRALAGESNGGEASSDLAAVLNAADAKSLAQLMLARAWANRDAQSVRLPPKYMPLQPGSILSLEGAYWTARSVTLDGFVAVAELSPLASGPVAVAGDGGRILPSDDVVAAEVTLGLFDVPIDPENQSNPRLFLAASRPTKGWKRVPAEIAFGTTRIQTQTSRVKSVLGHALTALGPGTADLIDCEGSVDVQLVDAEQWLTSCDDAGLAAGENLAIIGSELFQFARAETLGDGKFRLSRLLRGRGGSEWACIGHSAGELFCLADPRTLQPIPLPSWSAGASVSASVGVAHGAIDFRGEALRPPSPVALVAKLQPSGDLAVRWVRRSRLGFAWIDGVDAPLGEATERYLVSVHGALGSIELEAEQTATIVTATALASVGAGPASVQVRQVGDRALSRPGQLLIDII